ncbi:MAG: GC-type dockerin domain-anchored protein [Phycisphaerales bacterium]
MTSLIEFQGELIVGGLFNTAGPADAVAIARWNGASWAGFDVPLAPFSNEFSMVHSLAVRNDQLVVGGAFATAEGKTNLVYWSGSSWENLGDLYFYPRVYSMITDGGDLYVGGTFNVPDMQGLRRIGKFDGNTWSTLGGGIGGKVNDMLLADGELLMVGDFPVAFPETTLTDQYQSVYFAHWGLSVPVAFSQQPAARSVNCGSNATFTADAAGYNMRSWRWYRDGSPINNGPLPGGGIASGATTRTLTITGAKSADAGLFYVRLTTACGFIDSDAVTLSIVRPCGSMADMGGSGGLPVACGDGHLDNNDFIAFINHFFNGDTAGDIGRSGGLEGADGAFDNNDFIAFITLFFEGC